jgi:hypothetical protein
LVAPISSKSFNASDERLGDRFLDSQNSVVTCRVALRVRS